MNIFVIGDNYCPIQSAKDLCGKHCSRMPLESAGMLAFAFPEGTTSIKNDRKNRHYTHPASIWSRSSKTNFEWLLLHALAQCEEYTKRYKRVHSSQEFIEWAEQNYKYLIFDKIEQTAFARCFSSFKEPLDKDEPNTLSAYRKFYWLDKQPFAKWPSIKTIPDWWPSKTEEYVDKSFINGNYSKR